MYNVYLWLSYDICYESKNETEKKKREMKEVCQNNNVLAHI